LIAVGAHLTQPGTEPHVGIHEARKAIRRFRAVLPLCGGASEIAVDALDRAARRLGKSLSTLRDAHVVVQVAARRLKGNSPQGGRDLWRSLRDTLVLRRDALAHTAFVADAEFMRRRTAAAGLQKRFAALEWTAFTPEAILLALRRSSARVRRAEHNAKQRPTLALKHRWRRRARRLRMQLQCIAELAHQRNPASKEAQLQARWVWREAMETMPSIDTLNTLVTALGVHRDTKMLRDAVLLEKDLAGQDVLLEVLLKKLGKNKLPAKAGNF